MGQTETTTFRRLKGILRTATDRDFERAVLPWLRLLWSDTVPAPALGYYDRNGVDLIAWKTDQHAELVVQCKGFKVSENELGDDQVNQCLESIRKFEVAGLGATTNLLVYNRYGNHEQFRPPLKAALDRLVKSAQVQRAELWPCDKLLRESARFMRRRFLTSMRGKETVLRRDAMAAGEIYNVPLRTSDITVDRYQLKEVS